MLASIWLSSMVQVDTEAETQPGGIRLVRVNNRWQPCRTRDITIIHPVPAWRLRGLVLAILVFPRPAPLERDRSPHQGCLVWDPILGPYRQDSSRAHLCDTIAMIRSQRQGKERNRRTYILPHGVRPATDASPVRASSACRIAVRASKHDGENGRDFMPGTTSWKGIVYPCLGSNGSGLPLHRIVRMRTVEFVVFWYTSQK